MRVKEATVNFGHTIDIGEHEFIRPGLSVTFELEANESLDTQLVSWTAYLEAVCAQVVVTHMTDAMNRRARVPVGQLQATLDYYLAKMQPEKDA